MDLAINIINHFMGSSQSTLCQYSNTITRNRKIQVSTLEIYLSEFTGAQLIIFNLFPNMSAFHGKVSSNFA